MLSVFAPLTSFQLLLAAAFASPGVVGSGAASVCPQGTILVEGDHYDRVDYQCNSVKWGMCAGYTPGYNPASGTKTQLHIGRWDAHIPCPPLLTASNQLGTPQIKTLSYGSLSSHLTLTADT